MARVVLVAIVVLCILMTSGVPARQKAALPSGVFRLRFASVPPKKPAGLPSSPPNARGSVPLSASCPHSTWGGFEVPFGRSLPKSGRDRPQFHFPESATEKPRRHVRCRSGGHSAALRDRLQVNDWRTPRQSTHATCSVDRRSPKSRGAPMRRPFQSGRKTKAASATAYALPAKSAGSAPAVQCSRSLRKSLRDRLQGHYRGMPRKNKSRMPCFVQTGAPEKHGSA